MIASVPERRAGGGPESSLLPSHELSRLRREVETLLEPGPEVESRLAAAVTATLERPGSLWRAQLAWSVGRACGLAAGTALDVAAGIEAFQTASLLFDDLPSMDDSEMRRGAPCLHRVHGEATAILAALAFVHRGYARFWRALESAAPAARQSAEELIESCLGLGGILDGQARDIRFARGAGAEDEILRIAEGKTVALLRLSLVLPARLAGRDPISCDRLAELAAAWGLAYQILDDLGEVTGPEEPGSDARLGRPNLALAIGRDRAVERLDRELRRAERLSRVVAFTLPACRESFQRLDARLAHGRRELDARRRESAGG